MSRTLLLRDQIWAALGLFVLPAGCVGKEDYGDCDPDAIEALDPLTEDSGGGFSGSLYCVDDFATSEACLACDADCQSEIQAAFSAAHTGEVSGYSIGMECGPMWLDEGCCFEVSLSQWMEGRPFRVDGAARLAAPRSGEGWAVAGEPGTLPPEHRVALAEHWTRVALAEHASIASFARFSLHLLALGAPAALLAEAARAQADEVAHARACFSLASLALGRAVGPGPLDVHDPGGMALDRRGVVIATFVEGCINETLAAAEASLAAARATWAPAREALARIAEDEARHAALAWATVQWILEQEPELAGELREHLAMESRRLRSRMDERPGLAAYGLLSGVERARLMEEVLEQVVGPTLEALGSSGERSAVAV